MKKDDLCRSSSFFVFNHRYLSICSDISPAERFSALISERTIRSIFILFYKIYNIIKQSLCFLLRFKHCLCFCGLRKPIQEFLDVRSEQIPVHADHTVIFAVEFDESVAERGYVFFRCGVTAD